MSPSSKVEPSSIPTVILAGGHSQRLRINNHYKWQLAFGKATLLEYISEKLQHQTTNLVLNAPPPDAFSRLPAVIRDRFTAIIYDQLPNYQGPLSGLYASLLWAQDQGYPQVATIACDTPFFPDNLLKRLAHALQDGNAKAAIACSKGNGDNEERSHPVFGLWSTTLITQLESDLAKGIRAIGRWSAAFAQKVEFAYIHNNGTMIDPFFNINTQEEYQRALAVRDALSSCTTVYNN